MIGYRDTTYCISPNCSCGRKLTEEIKKAAAKWWGSEDAPIAVAYFCGGQPNGWPNKKEQETK